MCYVIVSLRSLVWTLSSLAALMAVLAGLLAPRWLIGPHTIKDTKNGTELFVPTVGIFNRCTRLHGETHCANFNVDGFSTDPAVFPGCWKASLFFLSFGLAVMALTVLAAVVGFCIQSIGRKSIFNLAGVAQAIAGILYLFGLILYPAGWGAERVQRICGPEADAFYLGDCNLGWAFYSAVIGVALTFACAMFSGQAEKSTASDKVQDQMNQGRNLICLA